MQDYGETMSTSQEMWIVIIAVLTIAVVGGYFTGGYTIIDTTPITETIRPLEEPRDAPQRVDLLKVALPTLNSQVVV